jgi:hypothetical protein
LEDHSYFRTLPGYNSIGLAHQSAIFLTVANKVTVNVDTTPIYAFEAIDAAKQCALPRTACAYKNHDFTFSDSTAEISQGMHRAEVLLHANGLNHNVFTHLSSA